MYGTADMVAYETDVQRRLATWWDAKADKSGRDRMQTYYSEQALRE